MTMFHVTSEGARLATVQALRDVADLLENGQVQYESGGITIGQPNQTDRLASITSDLVLKVPTDVRPHSVRDYTPCQDCERLTNEVLRLEQRLEETLHPKPKPPRAYKYVAKDGTELFVPASLWRHDPFGLFGLKPELVEIQVDTPLLTKEQMDHIFKVNSCRAPMVNFLSTGEEDRKLDTSMVWGLQAEGTMTKAEVREFLASALDLTPDATKP